MSSAKDLFLECQIVKSIRGGSFLPHGDLQFKNELLFLWFIYSKSGLPEVSQLASGRTRLEAVVLPSRDALVLLLTTGYFWTCVWDYDLCPHFLRHLLRKLVNQSKEMWTDWLAGSGQGPENSDSERPFLVTCVGRATAPWSQLSGWASISSERLRVLPSTMRERECVFISKGYRGLELEGLSKEGGCYTTGDKRGVETICEGELGGWWGGDRKDVLTTVYYSTGHSVKLGLSPAVLLEWRWKPKCVSLVSGSLH